LVHPTAVLASGTGSNAAADSGSFNAEWQEAAGQIALVTPLMIVGTDSYIETDMMERLKVRRLRCSVPQKRQLYVSMTAPKLHTLCRVPRLYAEHPD
jgi:hypothetical protein